MMMRKVMPVWKQRKHGKSVSSQFFVNIKLLQKIKPFINEKGVGHKDGFGDDGYIYTLIVVVLP